MHGMIKQPLDFMYWLRGKFWSARLVAVQGAGSHSWDLTFDCGRLICRDEIYAYQVQEACPGKDLNWRCSCGRRRTIKAELLHRMKTDFDSDSKQVL